MNDLIVQWFEDIQLSKTISFARLKQLVGLVGIVLYMVPLFEVGFWTGVTSASLLVMGAVDEYLRKNTTASLELKRERAE